MRRDSSVVRTWGPKSSSSIEGVSAPEMLLWRSNKKSPWELSCWTDLKSELWAMSGWAARYSFSNFLCFFEFLCSFSCSIVLKFLEQGVHFQLVTTETDMFELASTKMYEITLNRTYWLSSVQRFLQKWVQVRQSNAWCYRCGSRWHDAACNWEHQRTWVGSSSRWPLCRVVVLAC